MCPGARAGRAETAVTMSIYLVQFLRLTGAGDRLTTPENYGHARVILRGDDLPFLLAVPRHSSALLVAPTAQV